MIYFTYKLNWANGNGVQPKTDSSQDWLDIGYAQQPDGTLYGKSTKTFLDTFTQSQITDFEVNESELNPG